MLIRHALSYLPAQLLSPVAQLASMLLWTHWLAPEQMGLFALVTVTQELTQLIGLAWFSTYALRYLPPASDVQGRDRFLQTERGVLLVFAGVSLLSAAVTTTLLPLATPWGSHFLAMAAFFVTRASNVHYAERARAQAAFVPFTLLQCCGPILGLGFGWWGMHHFAAQATTLWWAYALAQAIGSLVAVPMLGVCWRLRRPDPEIMRAAIKFGLPMMVLWGLAWAAENIVRYQVQWQAGPAALGLMALGWGLGRRVASVSSMMVATAAFPLAARLMNEGRKEEAMAAQSLNLALVCAILAPVTLAVEMLGTDFVALLVASQYRETSVQILGLAMLSGAMRSLQAHTCSQALVLANRFKLVFWVDGVEIAATVLFAGVGLSLYGLQGAVSGACIGAFLALVLAAIFAHRELGLRWPWASLGRIAVAVGVMGVVIHHVHAGQSMGTMVLSALAGSMAYALALAAMWPQQVLAFVRQRRARVTAPHSTLPEVPADS
jgi:O-antigen/teichoic acid export membrane protein